MRTRSSTSVPARAGSPFLWPGVAQVGNQEIRRFVGGRMLPAQRKETRLVFEVYEDGTLIERIEERSLVGITSRKAIHRLLKHAGFAVRQEWRSYDREPFENGDSLLIVEAVKPIMP